VNYQDVVYIMERVARGDPAELDELTVWFDEFPHGDDGADPWITRAVAAGAVATVAWMIARGVDLHQRPADGYTLLLTALERDPPARYELLELLLTHGAPIDEQGINDWTPAHMAAAREDIPALELLVRFGADLSARTRIDSYATPLEEARILGRERSVRFLEGLAQQRAGRQGA
jgi:ankyrin repeat protein